MSIDEACEKLDNMVAFSPEWQDLTVWIVRHELGKHSADLADHLDLAEKVCREAYGDRESLSWLKLSKRVRAAIADPFYVPPHVKAALACRVEELAGG